MDSYTDVGRPAETATAAGFIFIKAGCKNGKGGRKRMGELSELSVLGGIIGGKSGKPRLQLFSSVMSGVSSDLISFSDFSSGTTGLTEFSRISSSFFSSFDPIMLSIVKPEPLGLLDKLVEFVDGLRDGGEIGIRGSGGKVPISGNPGLPSRFSGKFPGGDDLGGNGGGGGGIKRSCPPIGGMGGGRNGGWGKGG